MANENRCETLSIARRYSVVRWAKEPDKIRSNSTRKVFCLYRSTCPQQAVQRPTGIRGVMHKSATDRQHSVGPYKCDINGIVVLPDSTNSTVEVCTIVFAEDPNLVRALMSSPKTQIWGNTKSETILRWATYGLGARPNCPTQMWLKFGRVRVKEPNHSEVRSAKKCYTSVSIIARVLSRGAPSIVRGLAKKVPHTVGSKGTRF